ncbi:MAG: hypothetical protein JWM98_1070 [Thermoleophilia bacterium]|nr:hypothetical protein [Thermoleophilia bacterium]
MFVVALVVATSAWGSALPSDAATSSVVVTMDVASATTLTPGGCATATPGVTDFGIVQPGTSVTTTIDCTILFGSSNDSSSLHIAQLDGAGDAMRAAPTSAVVGEWRLNGVGAESNGGVPAVPAGTMSWLPTGGPPGLGGAASLNGGQFDVAEVPGFNDPTFTIEAWFRHSAPIGAGAYETIVARRPGGGGPVQFTLRFESGPTINMKVSGNGNTSSAYLYEPTALNYNDGAWHYMVGTVDAANVVRLYLDGALRDQGTLTGPADVLSGPISIGNEWASGGQQFHGDIDEVRFSSVPRTAAEIRSYYLGRVQDFGAAAGTDWAGSAGFFATCLRGASGGAMLNGTTWSTGTCAGANGAGWRAVSPSTGSASAIVARSTAGTTTARADLRFAVSVPPATPPGSYSAPLEVMVIAPAA